MFTSYNFADTMIYDVRAKLVPLPRERRERMNKLPKIYNRSDFLQYIQTLLQHVQVISLVCKQKFCREIIIKNCKLNIYFARKYHLGNIFAEVITIKTVCLSKTLSICRLPRWILRAGYLALFIIFSLIDGFEWFWMGSLHKNILTTFFLLYIKYLPDDVICNIAIYADDTTFYSKFDKASDCGNN